MTRAWLGVLVVGLGAASVTCARPRPQAGDSAAAGEAARPADTAARIAPAALPDTHRIRVPRPNDTRPWVPRRDSVALRPPTPKASAVQEPAGRWTAGVTAKRRVADRPVVLRAVRSSRNPAWDRVVFEFAGGQVPGYHVEYVDAPVVMCGSGDPTRVAGVGWLQVRFDGAQAHTDEGRSTVSPVTRKQALPVLRELKMTCDFEGEVTWVLGVAHPNRYRVMELSAPARLVVDVRH